MKLKTLGAMRRRIYQIIERLTNKNARTAINQSSASWNMESRGDPIIPVIRERARRKGAIARDDLEQVLSACGEREWRPYHMTPDPDGGARGYFRMDCSGELSAESESCLAMAREYGMIPLALLPVAAGNDAGVACEGRLLMSDEYLASLVSLHREYGCGYGFLADPLAVITRLLSNPLMIWTNTREKITQEGLTIHGYGCSFHNDRASLLNMIWVYRVAQKLITGNYMDLLSRLGFDCREWTYVKSGDPMWLRPLDGLSDISFTVARDERVYLRDAQITTDLAPELTRRPFLDTILYTDRAGWRKIDRGGDEGAIELDDVLAAVANGEALKNIGLIIDPSDIAWERGAKHARTNTADTPVVRTLPYPYHYYLAICSDIDWSTHSHFTGAVDVICDELGMRYSGSAYLCSRDPKWPSLCGDANTANGMERLDPGNPVLHWAGEGLIDTIHGVAYSYDSLTLGRNVGCSAGEAVIELRPSIDMSGYDGVMIATSSIVDPSRPPRIALLGQSGRKIHMTMNGSYTAGRPRSQHITYHPNETLDEAIKGIVLSNCPDGFVAREITTLYAGEPSVSAMLRLLGSYNLTMPVFTTHGGGSDRKFASLGTAQYCAINDIDTSMAMDNPGSPFYLLPALKSFGARFFNPEGLFSDDALRDIDTLVEPMTTISGERIYAFCRYYSSRDYKLSYGKHNATAQGIAVTLDEIIHRLRRAEPGKGCVVYTHLGHRVGNNITSRLGWNEEVFASLGRVAEYSQGKDRDNTVPYRIWFAPTSAILTYSAVMKGIRSAIRYENGDIHITSWHDPALGHSIPNPTEFGESWLHGVTIAIPENASGRVYVDGTECLYYTTNPPDALSGKSVTIVDAASKRQLIPAVESVALEENADAEPPDLAAENAAEPVVIRVTAGSQTVRHEFEIHELSLRNATHWTFEIFAKNTLDEWELGFTTDSGETFTAGTGSRVQWNARWNGGSSWKRFTFSLDDAAGPARPRGKIVRMLFGARGHAPGHEVLFRDISLIRPQSARRRTPNNRILAGRVYAINDGRPARGIKMRCESEDHRIETTTDSSGKYIFKGLRDNNRYYLALDSNDGSCFISKGNAAYMSCDQWDWDIAVAFDESSGRARNGGA